MYVFNLKFSEMFSVKWALMCRFDSAMNITFLSILDHWYNEIEKSGEQWVPRSSVTISSQLKSTIFTLQETACYWPNHPPFACETSPVIRSMVAQPCGGLDHYYNRSSWHVFGFTDLETVWNRFEIAAIFSFLCCLFMILKH